MQIRVWNHNLGEGKSNLQNKTLICKNRRKKSWFGSKSGEITQNRDLFVTCEVLVSISALHQIQLVMLGHMLKNCLSLLWDHKCLENFLSSKLLFYLTNSFQFHFLYYSLLKWTQGFIRTTFSDTLLWQKKKLSPFAYSYQTKSSVLQRFPGSSSCNVINDWLFCLTFLLTYWYPFQVSQLESFSSFSLCSAALASCSAFTCCLRLMSVVETMFFQSFNSSSFHDEMDDLLTMQKCVHDGILM